MLALSDFYGGLDRFLTVWIWYIYRHILGLIYLTEDKLMPA